MNERHEHASRSEHRRRRGRVAQLRTLVAFATLIVTVVVGAGSGTSTVSASEPAGELAAISLAGGGGNFCAATVDEDVYCWGQIWDGDIGDGSIAESSYDTTARTRPTRSDATGAEVSNGFCALDGTTVSCWGAAGTIEDGEGSLFSEPPWGSTTPQTYGFGPAAEIAGRCARLTNGRVQCQGWNRWGQLGDGTPSWPESGFSVPPPSAAGAVFVSGLTNVASLTSGGGFACAARTNGQVHCWGYGGNGELGDGVSGSEDIPCPRVGGCADFHHSSTPIRVPGIDDAESVHQNCAIRTGAKVTCWGTNSGNRFLLDTATDTVLGPTELPQFQGAIDVEVGANSVCAVLGNGSVVCQGTGPLGDGTLHEEAALVTVDGIASGREVAVAGATWCVRSADGTIACWGENGTGLLGNGTQDTEWPYEPQLAPEKILNFSEGSGDLVPDGDGLVPLSPKRLLETRVGEGNETVDGESQGIGRVRAGSILEVEVAGRGGVPGDAESALLNVTVVGPDAAGFVTVFPCGEDLPLASNLNYMPGAVVPNAVLAKLGEGGKVCLYSFATTDLLVDVSGFAPADATVAAVSPKRLLETRTGPDDATADGESQGIGRVRAGSVVEVQVAGRGGVPADAQSALFNVTAVGPSGAGFVTVFPCGEDLPLASNLNYAPGDVVPNAVLAKLGEGGKVCLYSFAETDLVVDVNGYVPSGSSLGTLVPARLLETRSGPSDATVDGEFEGVGRVGAGETLALTVSGRGGVPSGASAVMLNVTAVGPSSAGFVTVFPCGEDLPLASNVNYVPGDVVPNAVLAKVGTKGQVCLYSFAETDLVVDVNGYVD